MKQKYNPRKFTVAEVYVTFFKAMRTIRYFSAAKRRTKELDGRLTERIMLAVTEVNGCEICSYAHTRMALEAGLSAEEIHRLLSGHSEDIPAEEAPAVLFAQHYADTKGHPTAESWKRMIDTYGESKALGILGAVRMIMLGNVTGIPLSAFLNRLKRRPQAGSSLFYELLIMILTVVFIPISLAHSGFALLASKLTGASPV